MDLCAALLAAGADAAATNGLGLLLTLNPNPVVVFFNGFNPAAFLLSLSFCMLTLQRLAGKALP